MTRVPSRPLGATGLFVSLLGLGTVKFGRHKDVKYPHPFDLPNDAEARALLDHAAQLGITLLDTAPAYGISEQRLGQLLRPDDPFLIASKVGEYWNSAGSSFDFSAAATRASVTGSLDRLRRDHLDLVCIHASDNDFDDLTSTDCLGTLLDLKAAGDIRAIGFSAKSVRAAMAAIEMCDVVMLTLNPDDQSMAPAVAAAAAAGTGVLIKKALASGHTALTASTDAWLETLGRIEGVSSVIIGTLSQDHLTANARALAASATPNATRADFR